MTSHPTVHWFIRGLAGLLALPLFGIVVLVALYAHKGKYPTAPETWALVGVLVAALYFIHICIAGRWRPY